MQHLRSPRATSTRVALSFVITLMTLVGPLQAPVLAGASGVTREWGPTRYGTAANIATTNFTAPVPVVYVATGLNFPDALAAGAAAAKLGGPVLLVRFNDIPDETKAALEALDPGRIVIAGGSGVVSDFVAAQLDNYDTGGGVTREWGPNRFGTAANIATTNFDPGVAVVYVATGANFPDALAAGPAAAKLGGPVLLVRSNSIPEETANALEELTPSRIVIAGGSGVVNDQVAADLDDYDTGGGVTREWGPTRFGTAANVSFVNFTPGVPVVYVATGANFPDALAAGPSAAKLGGPVLLVRFNDIPAETAAELDRLNPARIVIAGGSGVVSDQVAADLEQYVGGGSTNQPPVGNDDSATVNEDTANNVINVLANDTDPDDVTLTVSAVTQPANGTVAITSGGGSVTYTPIANYFGPDSFTYTVRDPAGATDTATVNVTVTDIPEGGAPVANDDSVGSIAGTCMRILRVLANDTDPDGDPLTITAVSDPAKGDASIVGSFVRYVSDGTLGADTFTYTISDGTLTDTANVSINVFLGTNAPAGDLIPDECDPFAKIEDTSSDLLLGFVNEEFNDASGDWNSTIFKGIMTNSVDASLTQVTTNAHNGLGQFVVAASEGEAFSANNTQDNAFQVNVATDPALVDFIVHGRICTPYPTQQFGAAGIFFGPGDQENYVKLQLTPSATGVLQAQDVREVDGAGFGIARRNVMPGEPPPAPPACVELRIIVDVSTLTYSPSFSSDNGVTWTGVGGCSACRTVPANWLDGTYPYGSDAVASRALAAGIISTSQGLSPEFDATFDFFRVYAAP